MEGTSGSRSRPFLRGNADEVALGTALETASAWPRRRSLPGQTRRHPDEATGGVRTPWVGVKARLRAIAGELVGGVDAGPCPIPSPTGSHRKVLCHPETAAFARRSSDEDGRPSASCLGFEKLLGRARSSTRLQKPSSDVRPRGPGESLEGAV